MSTWLGASCVNLDTGEPEREIPLKKWFLLRIRKRIWRSLYGGEGSACFAFLETTSVLGCCDQTILLGVNLRYEGTRSLPLSLSLSLYLLTCKQRKRLFYWLVVVGLKIQRAQDLERTEESLSNYPWKGRLIDDFCETLHIFTFNWAVNSAIRV